MEAQAMTTDLNLTAALLAYLMMSWKDGQRRLHPPVTPVLAAKNFFAWTNQFASPGTLKELTIVPLRRLVREDIGS
jgi:hypothetical protein